MVKIEFFTMNLNENAKQEQQLSENKLSSSSFLLSLSPIKQQNQSKENSTDDEEDKLSNEFKQNFSVTSLNIINNNANSNNNNHINNNNNNNIEKKNSNSDGNSHSSSCSSSSSNSSSSSCSSNSSNNNVNLHNTNKNSSTNINNTNINNSNNNNINNNNNNNNNIINSNNNNNNGNDNNESNQNYIGDEATDEKFQFAKRLGYGEPLIYTALSRLGSEAKENELLAELIKLSDLPKLVSNNSSPTSMIGSRANELSALRNGNAPLRHIVIDGSNVALSHGNNEVFSCRGIKIAIDYFRQRGHREVTAFVPTWRKESGRGSINAIRDQDVLYELERDRVLVFTPSRLVDGKRVACYDDRYILKLAAETDGIVVSNDNYRDLAIENSEFHKVIKERILMYTFVNDLFMPPDDPLGRNGPSLDMFLRANQLICPYGKKCTYGNKCKYRHQNSINHPQLRRVGGLEINHLPITTSLSVPLNKKVNANREGLSRTMSSTVEQQNLQNQAKLLLNHQYSLSQANANSKSAGLSPSYNTSPTWQQQIQNVNNNNNNNNNSNNNNINNSNSNNLDDVNTQFQFNLKVNVHGCGNIDDNSNINRHKKLQRQVATRALQNQSLLTNMLTNGYHLDNHSNNNNSNNINNNLHRPLSSTISAPPQCMTNHLSVPPSSMSSSSSSTMPHQNITRIPSAPVSASAGLHVPIMQNYNILSASDSQLNDNYTQRSSQLPIQEQRRLLRFHLSSIFPQNQVDTVLKIYPNISDAKTICTALINLFPN